MKPFNLLLLSLLCVFFSSISNADKMVNVTIKTNMGDIKVALNAEKAPKSVANFLRYTKEGFYNDTIFHRVINGFMIQGGGMDQNMVKKTTHDAIKNEADNGLKNNRGTLAMARTADPDSATAQFFINLVDNDYLNFSGRNYRGWGYAVFGQVIDGMDVVDRMAEVLTSTKNGRRNVPDKNIVILNVSIDKEKPAIKVESAIKAEPVVNIKIPKEVKVPTETNIKVIPNTNHSDIKVINSTSDIQVH